jgi:hypothetical protein
MTTNGFFTGAKNDSERQRAEIRRTLSPPDLDHKSLKILRDDLDAALWSQFWSHGRRLRLSAAGCRRRYQIEEMARPTMAAGEPR